MRQDTQKRAAVIARLQAPDAATLSDRAIARAVACSHVFVGRLRRALASGAAGTGAGPRLTGSQAPANDVPDVAAQRARILNDRPDPSRDVLGSDLADGTVPVVRASPQNAIQELHQTRYGVPVGGLRVAVPCDLDIAN